MRLWPRPKPRTPQVSITPSDYVVYAALMQTAEVAKEHGDQEVIVLLLEAMEVVGRRFTVVTPEFQPRWDAYLADLRGWVRRKRAEQGQSEGC